MNVDFRHLNFLQKWDFIWGYGSSIYGVRAKSLRVGGDAALLSAQSRSRRAYYGKSSGEFREIRKKYNLMYWLP